MDAQQLKNSILQMAVQGKLVPQDPNDEPASVLLERIRKEKEKLIKEGKIKKEKNPSYIFRGADNTPYEKVGNAEPVSLEESAQFELPDSWEYVHPKDLGFFSSGKTPKPAELSIIGKYPYFKVADMNTHGNEYYLHITDSYLSDKYRGKVFDKGTIVFPKNGGAVFTNKKRVLKQDSLVDLNTGTFTPFAELYPKFIYYIFSSIDFTQHYKGTALPTVDMDSVHSIIWGLPPYNEQKRIAQKLDEILPLVEKYSDTESTLSNLNESFPEQLKKSILQLAVQGKLIPQDPNDEPASVLLERIRAEKERLIKEGKIKRDKNESVIFRRDNSHYEKRGKTEVCIDDELPFTIPVSWQWCHISDMCFFQEGPGILAKDFRPEGVPLIRIAGMQGSRVQLTGCNYLDPMMVKDKWNHFRLDVGDIVISTSASLDKIAEVDTEAEGSIPYTGLIRFKMYGGILKEYFTYFIKSPCYITQIANQEAGSAIKHYGPTHLKQMVIPIPPINEQQRIVDEINSVMPYIGAL